MHLVMMGNDRSLRQGKVSPFYRTLEGLSQHFDRISVLCTEVNRGRSAFSSPLFDNVHIYPYSGSALMFWQWANTTFTSIHKQNPVNCITVHAFPPYVHAFGALFVARQHSIPLLSEWHGLPTIKSATNAKEFIGALLTPYGAKLTSTSNKVRVVSSAVQKQLIAYGATKQSIVLAEAVYIDPQVFYYDSFTTKRYTFMFCGRIDANKRLKRCILALKQLPHAKLVVVGDGPLKVALQTLARKQRVAHQITWTGFIEEPMRIADYLRQSEVLVMPSGYEGGPRVVVEALACGTPVIATPVGIVSDTVVHEYNGYITTGSVRDIVRAIQYIQSHPECTKTAEHEASEIAKRFDRSVLITKYADLLKEVANNTR